MPRSKQDYTGIIRALATMCYVFPRNPETVIREDINKTSVPAIEAFGPDGRRWFITFEAEREPTDRAGYIRRMRRLAKTILDEANRMEQEPNR